MASTDRLQFLWSIPLSESSIVRLVFVLAPLLAFLLAFYWVTGLLVVSTYANPENANLPLLDFEKESEIFCEQLKVQNTGGTASLDSLPSPQRASHFQRFPGSPTPEGDEFLLFNRKLFYQNLNSSAQYLRRDSVS